MEKRTVRVVCEFEFDITQDDIDAGQKYGAAATFDMALEVTRQQVDQGQVSLVELVEDGFTFWSMRFVQENKGVPAIRRIEGYNPIGV